MPHVALITARAAHGLDPDLVPLAAALESIGAHATIECWDAPTDWSAYDAAILRSAWDYPERLAEFTRWIQHTATETLVLNPPRVIDWNLDKRYLADLHDAAIPIVPTRFVAPGQALDVPGGPEVVVKPSISAGARSTGRFEPDDPTLALLAQRIWSSGRTVMLQPYLEGVDTVGEHALVYLDGEYSHAFRKGALLDTGAAPTSDLFAEEEISPLEATALERAVGRAAVDHVADATGVTPLYARVDLVPDTTGAPVVLELELIEPSVYHHVGPGSADRFAAAILRRL